MIAYSQKDPAYRDVRLGKTRMTIGTHGCYVCALATLYQVHPLDILKIPGAITNDGLVVSSVVAAHFGGTFQFSNTAPKGWCVAVTDFYKPQDYPTHFFPFNAEKKTQIDPLDFPAKFEQAAYPITQYRVFTNTKLAGELEQPGPFPDVKAGDSGATEIAKVKAAGIMGGYPDGLFRPDQPCTRRELAIVAAHITKL